MRAFQVFVEEVFHALDQLGPLPRPIPLRLCLNDVERGQHCADHRLPLERVNRLVSVIAADAWWAEAVAQQLAGCEIEEAMRVIHDAAALIVDPDGAIHHVNGYEEYLA